MPERKIEAGRVSGKIDVVDRLEAKIKGLEEKVAGLERKQAGWTIRW